MSVEPVSTQSASAAATALQVRLATHTDPGRVRDDNEDRLTVFCLSQGKPVAVDALHVAPLESAGLLLLVADGMGGMSGGEQASQMCIEIVPEEFRQRLAAKRDESAALTDAIREANRRILERAKADVKLRGMGCTLTAVVLNGSKALVGQVGDSRAYLGRNGEVTQVTRDQTVWESLRDQGKDPETALGSNQFKSMLLQAVGAQDVVEPVLSTVDLGPGDWLVMCTDGLYRVVTPEDIREVLKKDVSPLEKARSLTALANQNGGPDNVSVIVCEVTPQGGMSKAAA